MIQKKAKPAEEEEGGEGDVTKTVKDPTWEYYYEGFMIDLLHEIEKRYEKSFGKKFPEYRITTSAEFSLVSDAQIAGGFGYRSIPKTGAGAKKEDEAKVDTFGGLVKEVGCNKVTNFLP